MNLQARLDVEVPLIFVGVSKGVQLDGGVMEPSCARSRSRACRSRFPSRSRSTSRTSAIGDAIHVRDIQLPPDVVSKVDGDTTVVHVVAPRLEEEPVVAAAVPAEGEAAVPAEGAAEGAAPAADKKAED